MDNEQRVAYPHPAGMNDAELDEFRRRLNALRDDSYAQPDNPPAPHAHTTSQVQRSGFKLPALPGRSIASIAVFVLILAVTVFILMNNDSGENIDHQVDNLPDGMVVAPSGEAVEPLSFDTNTTALISSVYGTVNIKDSIQEDSREPRRGEVLSAGMRLETDTDGYAVLAVSDGTAIVLGPNTTLSVGTLTNSAQPSVELVVLGGTIYAFPNEADDGEPAQLILHTQGGTTTISGASTSINIPPYWGDGLTNSGNAIMRCFTGVCYVQSQLGDRAQLEAGSKIEIFENGTVGSISQLTSDDARQANNAFVIAQNSGLLGQNTLEVAMLSGAEVTQAPNSGAASAPTATPTRAASGVRVATPTSTPGVVCGDGFCSVPGENTEICATDCVCVDDGVCRASLGEGANCADCAAAEEAAPPAPNKSDRAPERNPVATATPQPTGTARPTNTPRPTFTPFPTNTATPIPPTKTPTPIPPTNTPVPPPTNTPVPPPTNTPKPPPTNTPVPPPTNTPVPPPTNTPVPPPTNTPVPPPTDTPVPPPTNTPVPPTNTPVPPPTDTPVPPPTNTPVPTDTPTTDPGSGS